MVKDNLKIRSSSWTYVPQELGSRVWNAIASIRFVFSFLVGIVLIGGMGIWLPFLVSEDVDKVFFNSQNLFTYAFAILGTLFIDFVLSKESTTDLSLLAVFIGIVSMMMCFVGYYLVQDGFQKWTVFGAGLSVVLFLLVNVNDEKYDSMPVSYTSTSTGYKIADSNRIVDSGDDL